MRMTAKARKIVRELFDAFIAEPRLLPVDHQAARRRSGPRAIADYVAGMTDRSRSANARDGHAVAGSTRSIRSEAPVARLARLALPGYPHLVQHRTGRAI